MTFAVTGVACFAVLAFVGPIVAFVSALLIRRCVLQIWKHVQTPCVPDRAPEPPAPVCPKALLMLRSVKKELSSMLHVQVLSALFSCNSSLLSLPSHPAGGYSVNVRRVSYTGYRDLTLLSAHVIQLCCGLQCSPSPQSQQQYQRSYPWHQRGLAAPWMMIATYPSAPTPWQLATAALKARSRVRQVARPQHRESYLVAPFRDYSGHQRLC